MLSRRMRPAPGDAGIAAGVTVAMPLRSCDRAVDTMNNLPNGRSETAERLYPVWRNPPQKVLYPLALLPVP